MDYPSLPHPSQDHTVSLINNNVYLVGGLNANTDSILKLDLSNPNQGWYPLNSTVSSTLNQTNGHVTISGSNYLMTFFGQTPPNTIDPISFININEETGFKVGFPNSVTPFGRIGHRAIVDANSTWIFGGFGLSSKTALNDLSALDMKTGNWAHLSSSFSQNRPSPRSSHGFVKVKSNFYLVCFGEDEQGNLRNDCFSLDVQQQKWSTVNMDNTPPLRSSFSFIQNPNNENSIIMYGGMNRQSSTVFNDFWQADVSNLVTNNEIKWTQLNLRSSSKSYPRYNHDEFVYKGSLVVVGGLESVDDHVGQNNVWGVSFDDLNGILPPSSIKNTDAGKVNYGLIFGLLFFFMVLFAASMYLWKRIQRHKQLKRDIMDEVEKDFVIDIPIADDYTKGRGKSLDINDLSSSDKRYDMGDEEFDEDIPAYDDIVRKRSRKDRGDNNNIGDKRLSAYF